MIRDSTPEEQEKALKTLSEIIEVISGGLVLPTQDDSLNDEAHKAVLRSLMQIATGRSNEVQVTLGNATKGQ